MESGKDKPVVVALIIILFSCNCEKKEEESIDNSRRPFAGMSDLLGLRVPEYELHGSGEDETSVTKEIGDQDCDALYAKDVHTITWKTVKKGRSEKREIIYDGKSMGSGAGAIEVTFQLDQNVKSVKLGDNDFVKVRVPKTKHNHPDRITPYGFLHLLEVWAIADIVRIHRLTWRKLHTTGGLDKLAEYYLDGVHIGKGSEGVRRLAKAKFCDGSVLVIYEPWVVLPSSYGPIWPLMGVEDVLRSKGVAIFTIGISFRK